MSQDIKPGWYWAKYRKMPEAEWEVVLVSCLGILLPRRSLEVQGLEVQGVGWSPPHFRGVDDFEFGPRIEEPPP